MSGITTELLDQIQRKNDGRAFVTGNFSQCLQVTQLDGIGFGAKRFGSFHQFMCGLFLTGRMNYLGTPLPLRLGLRADTLLNVTTVDNVDGAGI